MTRVLAATMIASMTIAALVAGCGPIGEDAAAPSNEEELKRFKRPPAPTPPTAPEPAPAPPPEPTPPVEPALPVLPTLTITAGSASGSTISGVVRFAGTFTAGSDSGAFAGYPIEISTGTQVLASAPTTAGATSATFDFAIDTTTLPNGGGYCFSIGSQFTNYAYGVSVCNLTVSNDPNAPPTLRMSASPRSFQTVSGMVRFAGRWTASIASGPLAGPAEIRVGTTVLASQPLVGDGAALDFDLLVDTTALANGSRCFSIGALFTNYSYGVSLCNVTVQN